MVSRVVRKERCPSCAKKNLDNQSDNLIIYMSPDGEESCYCFACGYTRASTEYKKKKGFLKEDEEIEEEIVFPMTNFTLEDWIKVRQQLSVDPKGYRKLKKSTTERYQVYHEFDDNGNLVKQYYPVTKTSSDPTAPTFSGVKIRSVPKAFKAEGTNDSSCELFGQCRFPNNKSKMVVITSGELDCLAVYQMLSDNRKDESFPEIPVVSGTIGENGSHNQYRTNYDFLNSFEKIILIPDQDEAGLKAIDKAAQALPKEKLYVVDLPAKDPTDMLEQGRQKEFINAFWKHKYYSPAGIHGSDTIYDAILERAAKFKLKFPTFLEPLNAFTGGGISSGAIVTIAAGSGIGKSTLINQTCLEWFTDLNQRIGILSLEADKGQLGENLLGMHIGTKLQLISNPEEKVKFIQSDTVKEAARELFLREDGTPSFFMIDDRGDFTGIEEKIEKLIIAQGVTVVIIDVLSDILDTMTISEQAAFMGWQKNICKRYGIMFVNIMHIRKSSGGQKAASEGGSINDDSLSGSSTVLKSSSLVLALQRNKVEEDETLRNVVNLIVLKNRDGGLTGPCMQLIYNNQTARLEDFSQSYEQYKQQKIEESLNQEDKDKALNRF